MVDMLHCVNVCLVKTKPKCCTPEPVEVVDVARG